MVCREQDSGFYDLGQGHCGGSNFVNFDVNIHIGSDGRVCSETNMHERIRFFISHLKLS
jgi:hypothetical protein